MAIIVHIASVWVPFTSESKEAIASYPEILKEIKLGLQECRAQARHPHPQGQALKREFEKRSHIEKYIPHIGIALQEILDLSDRQRDKTVEHARGRAAQEPQVLSRHGHHAETSMARKKKVGPAPQGKNVRRRLTKKARMTHQSSARREEARRRSTARRSS